MNVGNIDLKPYLEAINNAKASVTASTGVAKQCLNSIRTSIDEKKEIIRKYENTKNKNSDNFLNKLINLIIRIVSFIFSPFYYVASLLYPTSNTGGNNATKSGLHAETNRQ